MEKTGVPDKGEIRFDPVKVTSYSTFFRGITDEMCSVLIRTSGSPILSEANDFSACVFDPECECYAMSNAVIAFLYGHILGAKCVKKYYEGDIHPGDVWIGNDTFTSGTFHPADVNVIRPVFYNNEFLGLSLVQAHFLDMGGSVPGGWQPGVRDCYAEGLRFPMIRLVEKGKWNRDILRLIETNVRVPKWVIGDLRAMVAANIAAENRIHTIIEKYGMQDYLHYRQVVKQLTENTLRQRIKSIPNGSFSCEDFVEHDGHTDSLFKIRLNLTVEDEHLVLDFRGSDPQTQGIINGTYQTTVGFATSPIVMMLAWDLPPNSGLLNCFSVITDKNSICDASPPAPTSSAHADSGLRVCKMVNIVLARAAKRSSDPQITDRIVGNFHDNWPIVTFVSNRDQRGQYTVFSNMDASGSGGGALQSRDGLDCAAPSTSLNMLIPDAEMSEMNYPVLYLWRRLYKDSGGPGMYRGGLGINLAWTPTVSDMMGVVSNQSMHAPPRGIFGGYPGAVSQEIRIRGSNVLSRIKRQKEIPQSIDELEGEKEILPVKGTNIPLKVGETINQLIGGGGGVGDPYQRDPALVEQDIAQDRVSIVQAKKAYGVVIDPTTGKVDNEKTKTLRQSRFSKEIS